MTGEVKFRKKLSREQLRAFMATQPAALVVFDFLMYALMTSPAAAAPLYGSRV
jgi:hypothetical protein